MKINLEIISKNKSFIILISFVLLFSTLFILIESLNDKLDMNDFYVYFGATNDFFAGNNPYKHNYGLDSGHFKYAPTTLLLFSPFVLGKFLIIKYFHLLLSVIALVFSIHFWKIVIYNKFKFSKKSETKLLLIAFLLIAIHVTREFHLGNINLILLSLFTLGMYFLNSKRSLSYLLWSFMILLKPLLILTLIPTLIQKEWRKNILFLIIGACFFILPIFIFGWHKNLVLWSDWLKAIRLHGEYLKSPQSLQHIFNIYFGLPISWIPSILILILLIGIHVFDVWKDQFKNKQAIFFWSTIYLAFGQNFFITDTEHFLLALPLIMLLLNWLYNLKNNIYWVIFLIGTLLFSFDSMDLLGRKISTFVYDYGLLGIGNLIFIILGILIWKREKNKI